MKLRNGVLLCWTSCLIAVSLVPKTRASWIDPDTPDEAKTIDALTEGDLREYELVFSDEFDVEGRTFRDGEDPKWTAIDKNDYTNAALHFYKDDNVITTNGVLNITTERKINWYKAYNKDDQKFYASRKYIQSGMMQGWNKFCITGGIVEFSAKLPGSPNSGGLWPALWLLGNLARATYVASSDFMWPFSFNECDPEARNSQAISACDNVTHFGLEPGRGRGAPEIDLLETMQGTHEWLPSTNVRKPYLSASLQVAPGIKGQRPVTGFPPAENIWYTGMEYGNETKSELNPFFYGVTLYHELASETYQSDALSANMGLTSSHYKDQHLYRVEWEPPEEDGKGGYIKWFVDGELVLGVYGESLNITGSEIPSEPMYMLMNTAVSSDWGFPYAHDQNCPACKTFDCDDPACYCGLPYGYCDNFPAFFEIDYVRVYQAVNESKHVLGCSTEQRPTDRYIKGHADKYMMEGDKEPLKPIQNGGAECESDSDCGGTNMGTCQKSKCECTDIATGPTCRAYQGFYDVETEPPPPKIQLSQMYIPPGLLLGVFILFVGFVYTLVALTMKIRKSKPELKYVKLGRDYGSMNGGLEVPAGMPTTRLLHTAK